MPRIESDLVFHDTYPETLLDVYTPDQDAPASGYPAVMVIHGGGWRVGDKSDVRQVQMSELLSAHGYLVFNINYTLAPKDADRDHYTALALKQCKQALAWARSQSERFHFDKDNMGAIGGSAGGNMALMLGFTAEDAAFNYGLEDLGIIKAVVNLYGPVTRPQNLRVVDQLHVQGPAILSIHGDADKTVDVQESYILDERLRALSIPHELIIVKGAPHTFNVISEWGDYSQKMLDFFDLHLKPS